MKNKFLKLAVVAVAVAGLSMAVQAVPISGSIAFDGTPVFNNAPHSSLGTATAFTALKNAYVAPGQQAGDFSALPNFDTVAFTPFTFVPPAASVVPLWTVTYSGITYSFDATSMTATFNSVLNIWDIGGNGIAYMTGKDATGGTWNLSAGKSGSSFFFGSSAVVPDGGMTVMLLGAALSAMGLLRKKLMA